MTLTLESSPAEVREAWADALESGGYVQGKGVLRDATDNSFCCLGVLTDLYIKATGDGEWKHQPYRRGYEFTAEGAPPARCIPGLRVQHWAGIDATGHLKGDAEVRDWDAVVEGPAELVLLNDRENDPYTFADIAQLIRSDALQVTE